MDHQQNNETCGEHRRQIVIRGISHDCDSSALVPLLSDSTIGDPYRLGAGRWSPARPHRPNHTPLESNHDDYLCISQEDDNQYRNARIHSTVDEDDEEAIIGHEYHDHGERTDDAIVPQNGNTEESRRFLLSIQNFQQAWSSILEVKIKVYTLCILLCVVIPFGFLMISLASKDFQAQPSPFPPANDPTPTPSPPSNPPIPKPPSPQPTPSPRPIPPSDRMDSIKQCTMFLSGLNELELDDVQFRAVSYFATSPGTDIDAPLTCTWDSKFGQVYSLIVHREAAHVKDEDWFTKRPLKRCHWSRVKCDKSGNIVSLIFNHDELNGFIPAELSGLVYLEELDLFSNGQLTGSLPSELGLLTQLTFLQVHHTSISGPVPTELGSLSALEELLMDNTGMTGTMPAQVCALRNQALQRLTAPCRGGEEAPLVCDRKTCCSYCSK